MDCMDLMSEYPDGHFDLAIVDPPYGIDIAKNGILGKNKFTKKNWDKSIPNKKYFDELYRVSKNQIIWGANYMTTYLLPSKGWIYWDKLQNKEGHRYGKTYSSGELAYSSFNKPMQHFEYKYQGNYIGTVNNITTKTKIKQELKIHPTQKPIKLYEWILSEYAEKGQTILDTHFGSGSIAIACHYFGCHLTASELDEDYYKLACERIARYTQQQTLF